MIEWAECWYCIWLTWQSRVFCHVLNRLLIISHQMDYLGPQLNNPASFDQSDYIPTDENFNICLNLYLNHVIMLIISQWIGQKLVLKKEIWMNDPYPASPKPTTHPKSVYFTWIAQACKLHIEDWTSLLIYLQLNSSYKENFPTTFLTTL